MKCSICGYRARDIKGMGAHYRKKHPRKMAQKRASRPGKMTKAAEVKKLRARLRALGYDY